MHRDPTAADSAASPYRYEPAPQPKGGGSYRWAIVGMLWFICFFNYADRQAISAVLPLLKDEFKFSDEQLGLIVSAFMWTYGLTAPLGGIVGDRLSRKFVILGGLYVWSAVTGMTAFCQRFWQFVFVRGAEGLGETFYFPASMSLVSDYHGTDTRSRAMSLHQTGVYAGIIGGGVVTGWVGQHWGWRTPFLFFGGGGILLGLFLMWLLKEPQRNQAEQQAAAELGTARQEEHVPWLQFVVSTLSSPASGCLLLAFVGANTVAAILYAWLTTYIQRRFNLSLAMSGVIGTVPIQVGAILGALAGGVLADRFRQRWRGGRAAVQALGIIGGIPMLLLCTIPDALPIVITGLALLGVCKGMYDSNIWPAIYEVVPAPRRSSAVGLANLVGWGGGGCGAWLLGRAVDKGTPMAQAIAYTAIIYVIVALLLVATAVLFTPRQIRAQEAG